MCEECLADAMAFHDFAMTTRGNLQTALDTIEFSAPGPNHLCALATMGVYMCGQVVKKYMPPGGKFIVFTREITDTELACYKPQLECMASAIQRALDAEEYPGDAALPGLETFIMTEPRVEGVKLVAVIVLNYLQLVVDDMERVRSEASRRFSAAIDDLLTLLNEKTDTDPV